MYSLPSRGGFERDEIPISVFSVSPCLQGGGLSIL
jgi:hypothetical protein